MSGATLSGTALSVLMHRPSHRAGVSALKGYDPRVRCAAWHTCGRAGREPCQIGINALPRKPSGAGSVGGCCPFDRIAPLSGERDAITEGLRAFNREPGAVGGVALWVSHDGSLGKIF